MRIGGDVLTLKGFEVIDIPDREGWTLRRAPQCLVEVTVEDLPLVVDADQIQTHEMGKCLWIEMVNQAPHVIGVLAIAFEFMSKALDGHVGQRNQTIKGEIESFSEDPAIVGFEIELRRGQRVADWVVDEDQFPFGIARAVSQAVKSLKCRNASAVGAPTSLPFEIFQFIAGKRGHDLYPVLSQELGGIFLSRFVEHGQIAAIDDPSI